jgi:predicted dehydrogenase
MVLGTDVESIKAFGVVEGGCDSHMQALLRYKSGAIAAVSSATKLSKPADAYIYGTKGHIAIPNFYTADRFTVTRGAKTEEYVYPYIGNGFEEEILEVWRAVGAKKTESDIHPLSRTLAVIGQMDEIRKQIGVSYPLPGEK